MTTIRDEPTGKSEYDDPDDEFHGSEWVSVLYTAGGPYRAGKSYRPDPIGERRAVKAADYKSGSIFLSADHLVEDLAEFFELLKELSTDPYAFIIRGVRANWGGGETKKHRLTNKTGVVVYRRAEKIHGTEGYFMEWPFRHLQMLDLDGVPLPEEMSVIADPEACVGWAVEQLLPPEFGDTDFVYQLSSSAGLTKKDDWSCVGLVERH